MKKITLLVSIFFSTVFANATLLKDWNDFFASSATGSGVLEVTTTGTVGTWGVSSTNNGGANPTISANTLNYTDGNLNYIDNNAGSVISLSAVTGTPAARYSIYYLTSAGLATGTSYYVSALINISESNTSQAVMMNFNNSSNGNSQYGRVYIKQAADNSGFVLGVGTYSSPSGYTSTLNYNTTYLIVLKYVYTSTTSQAAYLYINPVLGGSEPASPTLTAAANTSSVTAVKGFVVAQTAAMSGKIAGLRMGTTWEDVAKGVSMVTEKLSTPTTGIPSDATATGFTANWTTVANAVGYDVKVYLGTNLISTTNVSGQAASSLAITGLMSGITYTYQVIAKGDLSNYSDSDPSLSSSEVTTLDPYATNALNTDFNDNTWGEIASSQPAAGSYPSYTVNGFDLNSAILYAGSARGIKGEYHTNRIAIDKSANGGKVALPTINALQQIEVHATAGTAGNGFQLKEFNATTNSWAAIGETYVYNAATKAAGTDSIYIISLPRTSPTKLRIENPTNGGIYIYQVITRNTNPSLLDKPEISDATNATVTGFTANWTPVANATGYKVWVYKSTTNVATVDANGQTTQSIVVDGLQADSTYTYKVQAIGDGYVNYSDSFLSFASSTVTTLTDLGTGTSETGISKAIIVKDKTIITPETGEIEVYNLQGLLVYQVKNIFSINTNLPAGLYVVKFTNNLGKQTIQKISIK